MSLKFRCYAYGSGENWEAICVDLDIAVFGDSANEVEETLDSVHPDVLGKNCRFVAGIAATILEAKVPLVREVQAGAQDLLVRLPGRQ